MNKTLNFHSMTNMRTFLKFIKLITQEYFQFEREKYTQKGIGVVVYSFALCTTSTTIFYITKKFIGKKHDQ